MKSVDEASAEILAAFEPVGVERVALLDALGRFTSEAVLARSALPGFDQSAMDGYAGRAFELSSASQAHPVAMTVRGESRAGGEPPGPLAAGCVMRIFTGAMLPQGADAVVPQEDTERDGDTVRVRCAPGPDAHVRRRASDLAPGAVCCEAGSEIGSGEVGLLASQDVASISVWKRPRVAIVCTGDELRDIGEPSRPGSIVSSNSYALSAQVREAGAEAWVLPTVRDQRASAAHAIRNALSADVVVISGGVSVGDYDVVRDALGDAGVALSFWKVRMKPGKPVAFGHHGRVPVLGLPGNPVSSWVTFELFVRPGLRKMVGANTTQRRRARVTLAAAIERTPGRDEFARARLTRQGDGRLVAHLATQQGSGSLPALVGIDALVLLPAHSARLGPSDPLHALILREPPGPES